MHNLDKQKTTQGRKTLPPIGADILRRQFLVDKKHFASTHQRHFARATTQQLFRSDKNIQVKNNFKTFADALFWLKP
jgi:hypothetical protein